MDNSMRVKDLLSKELEAIAPPPDGFSRETKLTF